LTFFVDGGLQERHASSSGNALQQTCRLLELMATGQLLPPPLSYLSEIIGHISPHEVPFFNTFSTKNINYIQISVKGTLRRPKAAQL